MSGALAEITEPLPPEVFSNWTRLLIARRRAGRYTRLAMPAAAFDTLGAARELEAAGIARVQAEAIAQVINHGDERGVSKADLDAVVAGFDATIAGLETRLRADLASKADLREAVADLATRAELREAVAGLATRAELREAVADLATRAELSAIRDAIAGMRWTIGLLAAFVFAVGLRVFGLL